MPLKLYVIAAACENMGIGYKNDLPWRLKNEMNYFTRMTSNSDIAGRKNAVIMGRRTWDSIPLKWRPLSNRVNIVLSRNESFKPEENDVLSYTNWDEAVDDLNGEEKLSAFDKVWVVGGSHIYKMAVNSKFCHRIHLTRILHDFNCDTFFPDFDQSKFQLINVPGVPEGDQEENGIKYRFEVYERIQ